MFGIIFGFICGIVSSMFGLGFNDIEFWIMLVSSVCVSSYIEFKLQK